VVLVVGAAVILWTGIAAWLLLTGVMAPWVVVIGLCALPVVGRSVRRRRDW
jgi:Na+-transporting NADH:ubiquinone oxidoreductase subunit NqrB